MKQRLFTSTVMVALVALTGMSICAAEPVATDNNANGGRPRHHRARNAMERMTKALDLTPEQQAKIGPILDQARPQMEAARNESKQKVRAIRDNVRSQIKPLLTPAQQQKWDAIQKARQDMRRARQEMREATEKHQ